MAEEPEVIEAEEAEVIDMGVIKYDVTTAAIAKLQTKYAGFEDKDMDDKKEYALVHDAERELKALRLSIDKRRKGLKADALSYGKKVDAKAKEITLPIVAMEAPLKDKRLKHDMKAEIARREEQQKEQERIDRITGHLIEVQHLPSKCVQSTVESIDDSIGMLEMETFSDYDEFSVKMEEAVKESLASLKELRSMKVMKVEQEKLAAERAVEQAKKDEEQRKHAEAIVAQQAEQQKLIDQQAAELAAQKKELDDEKLALQRAEQEKQRLENEKVVAAKREEQRIENEKVAKEQAEKQRVADFEYEEKRRKEEEARLQKEQQRLAEISLALGNALKAGGWFKSGTKVNDFLAAVKAGTVPNIKFYL